LERIDVARRAMDRLEVLGLQIDRRQARVSQRFQTHFSGHTRNDPGGKRNFIRHQHAHFGLCLGGGGAVVAYSAAVSVPDLSASAPLNLPIVFAAHSSNDKAPLPLVSSLANALRRAAKISSA